MQDTNVQGVQVQAPSKGPIQEFLALKTEKQIEKVQPSKNNNVVKGNKNGVKGNLNGIKGNGNKAIGDSNVIVGNINKIGGNANTVIGS